MDKFVAGKVESGRYTSASEVVREALRLLDEHDRTRAAQIAAFNRELGTRLRSLDRGNYVEPRARRERVEIVAATQGARDIPSFLQRRAL